MPKPTLVVESDDPQVGLLEAAGKLFRQKGFAATTVREIAEAAGVWPGSLHYYFPTKESILLALMEQGIQKGGITRLEEARLHLAIAYLAAGQKAKAVAAFKSVQGADATADLARLWLIHAQRSSG